MAKLGILTPDPLDGCSWYRGAGALPYLSKYGHEVVRTPDRISWADLVGLDVLYMQRPHSEGHLGVMRMARELNVPVWVDYDDDLWSIPPTNPASMHYDEETLHRLLHFGEADVITCSTPELRDRLREEFRREIRVIPNAINDYVYTMPDKPNYPDNLGSSPLYWRGSDTHIGDLLAHRAALQRIIELHTGEIHFFGFNPWMLKAVNSAFIVHGHQPAPRFMRTLQQLKPGICLAPLDMREMFNHSKSPIAQLEALAVGAIPVASYAPSFNGITDLSEAYDACIEDVDGANHNHFWFSSAVREMRRSGQLLSEANRLRSDILSKLTR
jgi:hypothetical protein